MATRLQKLSLSRRLEEGERERKKVPVIESSKETHETVPTILS